jgi:hypothetical protein
VTDTTCEPQARRGGVTAVPRRCHKWGVSFMIDRIKAKWKEIRELNDVGRFLIVLGIACFSRALWYCIFPPTPMVYTKKMESYSDQVYRLFGLWGVVILWICFGGAFIWVGLLVGKNKPK